MTSKIGDLSSYSSTTFNWTIENFSQLNAHEGHPSDVFSVGDYKWKVLIHPKGIGRVYNHLSLRLVPINSEWVQPELISLAVISQTDPTNTKKRELKEDDRGWKSFMRLSELHDPQKGYIVNDTCIIKVEVSCRMEDDEYEGDEEDTTDDENEETNSQLIDYPGAGQPFGEGNDNSKVGFGEDKQEFEDIGGFHILKTQAQLYRQIWLKYGHIPSTKVMPIASYSILVLVVKDLMACILNMHKCHYVELSSEMMDKWEVMITMAEKFEFNIGWLRKRFEHVKLGIGGMQNVKTELLEHGQPLRAGQEKMKILRDAMKKVEHQLIEAKGYVRENTCGLLSEPDMEMYLEIGETLLLDGLF